MLTKVLNVMNSVHGILKFVLRTPYLTLRPGNLIPNFSQVVTYQHPTILGKEITFSSLLNYYSLGTWHLLQLRIKVIIRLNEWQISGLTALISMKGPAAADYTCCSTWSTDCKHPAFYAPTYWSYSKKTCRTDTRQAAEDTKHHATAQLL